MTITEKDLFLAILAMDSYNRGSGAGINDGDLEGVLIGPRCFNPEHKGIRPTHPFHTASTQSN